jgi:hypothetical protein
MLGKFIERLGLNAHEWAPVENPYELSAILVGSINQIDNHHARLVSTTTGHQQGCRINARKAPQLVEPVPSDTKILKTDLIPPCIARRSFCRNGAEVDPSFVLSM